MPDLRRGQISKANKKHSGKFAPKYTTFSILQNKIKDVVNKSKKLWKSIYKLIDDKDEDTNKAKTSEKEKEAKTVEEEKEIAKQEEEKKEKEKEKEKAEEKKGDEERKKVKRRRHRK